jgi:hypothetical protein
VICIKKISLMILMWLSIAGSAKAAETGDWNIVTSPLGLMVGLVNIELGKGVHEQLIVGGQVAYWDREISDVKMKVISAAGFGEYCVDKCFVDSWIAFGKIGYTSIDASATNILGQKETAQVAGANFTGMGGYHWFWENFNLRLAAGAAVSTVNKVEVKESAGNVVDEVDLKPVNLALDFSVGWRF